MFFIDENTDRATLEEAAIVEIGFDPKVVDAATDNDLRAMIIQWIEAGDECAI